MGNLSENWSDHEFECKCGCGFGLHEGDISPVLVLVVQEIRDILECPVYCVRRDENGNFYPAGSGCRCQKHNKAVGGVKASKHRLGEASDLWTPFAPLRKLYEAAEAALILHNDDSGGLGWYPNMHFVHADVRRVGRIARW